MLDGSGIRIVWLQWHVLTLDSEICALPHDFIIFLMGKVGYGIGKERVRKMTSQNIKLTRECSRPSGRFRTHLKELIALYHTWYETTVNR